jgi:hypothetical protein
MCRLYSGVERFSSCLRNNNNITAALGFPDWLVLVGWFINDDLRTYQGARLKRVRSFIASLDCWS